MHLLIAFFWPTRGRGAVCPSRYGYGNNNAVPLAAMLDNSTDTAITLSVAPAGNLISMTQMAMLLSGDSMGVMFRPGYRVSSGTKAISLQFHLTGSRACPRDVLRRYVTRHDEYFSPPNPNVHYRGSGMGSYAATQGPLDQIVDGAPLSETMAATGYTVNWDATFWWPYIMMIAPTIASTSGDSRSNVTELWGSALDREPGFNNRLATVHVKASYAIREGYYKNWSN